MKYVTLLLSIIITLILYSESLFINSVSEGDTVMMDNVIYSNSLLVRSSSIVLAKGNDYIFSHGVIVFKGAYDSVMIMYTNIPIKMDYTNYTYRADTTYTDSFTSGHDSEYSKDDIFVGGVKGFNVSVNNNGALSFNQSLEMTMEGNIDDRWTLRGNIYDDGISGTPGVYNIPVSQIENINISLYDSLNKIILGNSRFSGYSGRFTSINRQVLGLYGITHMNGYEIKASVAGQKGQYKEKSFYCKDNIQGPYALTDEILLLDYIITPESDHIFADGIELRRGEDGDYTINYQTGEIYFTEQYIVNSGTLIYAQFQTYEQSSSMTGYYGGFASPDSLVRIIIMREEQNVSSQSERDFFSSLGSDSSTVFLSTVEYVGEYNGDYILSDSVLEYAGFKQGDYTASFYYVGANNGDYIYSPVIKAYIYAGTNNGNYMPGRTLALPYESNYFSADILYPIGNIYIDLSSGGGLYKRNRYSVTGDYAKDIAYTGEIGIRELHWDKFAANMYYKRMYFPELYREIWNHSDTDDIAFNMENSALPMYLQGDQYYAKMNIYDSYLAVNIASLDSLFTRKFTINIDKIAGMHIKGSRKINTIAETNVYENSTVEINRKIGIWKPGYIFQQEFRNGTAYLRNSIYMYIGENTDISFINEDAEGKINRQSNILSLRSSFSTGGFSFINNINYKHIKPDSGNGTNTLIMRSGINGFIKPWWSIGGNINISSLSEYEMRETYIYAGKAKGDYIYDSLSGNYIYDEYEGDYIRVVENVLSDNAVSSRDISFNTGISFNRVNIRAELDYADRVADLLTLTDNIENRDIYSFIYGDWKINNRNSLFADFHYIDNSMYSNNIYSNRNASAGFKHTIDNIQYTVEMGSDYQSNEGDYSYSTIDALYLSGNIRMDRNIHIYAVTVSLGKADAFYNDIMTDSLSVYIRKTTLELYYKYRFTENLSMLIRPAGTFNLYPDTSSITIPTTLYYRYPDGPSLNISSILSYNNDIFSVSGIYTAEYTQKLGFRQKAELSLYTYF